MIKSFHRYFISFVQLECKWQRGKKISKLASDMQMPTSLRRSSLLFLHQTLSISPPHAKQSVITGNVKYPWSKFNFMIARVADFAVYKTSIAIHSAHTLYHRIYIRVYLFFFFFLQPRNPRNQIELSPTEFTNDVATITFLFIYRHFLGGFVSISSVNLLKVENPEEYIWLIITRCWY